MVCRNRYFVFNLYILFNSLSFAIEHGCDQSITVNDKFIVHNSVISIFSNRGTIFISEMALGDSEYTCHFWPDSLVPLSLTLNNHVLGCYWEIMLVSMQYGREA